MCQNIILNPSITQQELNLVIQAIFSEEVGRRRNFCKERSSEEEEERRTYSFF
jgi:hypothetical protein